MLAARNSLLAKAARFGGVSFRQADYRSYNPQHSTVYCDPPYANTCHYRAVGGFNRDEFWETMRVWSVDNAVIISEYVAPNDFECIAEFPTKLGLRTSSGQNDRIERLFKWKYK